MSFPKAKLHRFNDDITCAPPPTTYDPKFDNKVKGAVIEKSKRFVEGKLQSATSLESLDSTPSSSHKECSVKDSFRTPQLPKKKIFSTPKSANDIQSSNQKGMGLDFKLKKRLEDSFRCDSEKKLIEQINELTRVHTSQLLEKNQEIAALQEEIHGLKRQNAISSANMANSGMEELGKVQQEYELRISQIKSNNEELISALKKDLQDKEMALEDERTFSEQLLENMKSEIGVLQENNKNLCIAVEPIADLFNQGLNLCKEMYECYFDLEDQIQAEKVLVMEQLEMYKCDIEALGLHNEWEIEKLTPAFENALEQMQQTLVDKIEDLEAEFDLIINDLASEEVEALNEASAEVNHALAEFFNCSQTFAERVEALENDCNLKVTDILVSLKACDDLNENLIRDSQKLEEEIGKLKVAKVEDSAQKNELFSKNELLIEELARTNSRYMRYEIAQNETSITIQILSERLIESEKEVENLNVALEGMRIKAESLKENFNFICSENNSLKEILTELQVSIVEEVRQVEQQLLAKLSLYRQASSEERQKLELKLKEKEEAIEMMIEEVDYYKEKFLGSSDLVSLYQTKINECKEETQELQDKLMDAEEDFKEKIGAQKTLYNDLMTEYNNLTKTYTTEKDELNSIIENMKEHEHILEKECNDKAETINELKVQVDDMTQTLDMKRQIIEKLEDTVLENEKHIDDLSCKLEHYVDCAQKTAQQINNLSKQVEEKDLLVKGMEESVTEKDLKLESLSLELSESKTYVQTVTEHMVSLMNELTDKACQIDVMAQELDMKNTTMIQVSEEYEKVRTLYEIELRRVEEMEKDMHQTQQDNEKYVDELISELVLEKERCAELMKSVELLEEEKKEMISTRSSEAEETLKERNEKNVLLETVERQKLELATLNSHLESQVKTVEFYKQAEQQKNEDLKMLLQTARQDQEEMAVLQEVLKENEQKIEDLQSEVIDSRNKIESLENDIATISEDKFILEEKVEAFRLLEIKYGALGEEKEHLEEELEKLRTEESDSAKAKETIGEFEKQIEQLESQQSELKSKCFAAEKRKNEYKRYCLELEESLRQLKVEKFGLCEEKEKMKEQAHEDSMRVTSLTAELADLECRNRELESMIGPFREQLVQFERERNALLSRTERSQKELRALELEHARALGHQNHKQKIKHVVKLTDTIGEQKKEIEKLRAENMKLRHAMEKSSKDKVERGRSVPSNVARGKENPRSLDTSPLVKGSKSERLTSPASALKERNTPI